jgi:hypothetical protein
MRTVSLTTLGTCLALVLGGCGFSASVGDAGPETVAPPGAPYTYTVPDGFSAAGNVSIDRDAGAALYRTGVAIETEDDPSRDVIVVSTYALTQDVTGVADADLQQELDGVLAGLASGMELSGPTRETVAGIQAFVYTLVDPAAGETSRAYYLFKGKNEISVVCQSKRRPADVERACAELLGSLTVT